MLTIRNLKKKPLPKKSGEMIMKKNIESLPDVSGESRIRNKVWSLTAPKKFSKYDSREDIDKPGTKPWAGNPEYIMSPEQFGKLSEMVRELEQITFSKAGKPWDFMREKGLRHPIFQLYAAWRASGGSDDGFILFINRLSGQTFTIPERETVEHATTRANLKSLRDSGLTNIEKLAKKVGVTKRQAERFLSQKIKSPKLSSGLSEKQAQKVIHKMNADKAFIIKNFSYLLTIKR